MLIKKNPSQHKQKIVFTNVSKKILTDVDQKIIMNDVD